MHVDAARILTLALLISGGAESASSGPLDDARVWIKAAVERVCPLPTLSGFDVQIELPGTWVLNERHDGGGDRRQRVLLDLMTPRDGVLTLERRAVDGRLQQFRASYGVGVGAGGSRRMMMLAIAGADCEVRAARAIRDMGGGTRFLDELDETFANVRWSETLQAKWPVGGDPGGARVGLIDTGLAYDLDIFRNNLARNNDGTPLGYDYWDLDGLPYDGDTSRGPFFPIRHGTAVASVLVREAPDTALIPLRYPQPDMARMTDVIAYAAAAGARVVAMPLGSNDPGDWTAFLEALRKHDLLAIVSAGNDGRNIDREPVFPAASPDENIITVTSADPFGRLANGSNWGPQSVDIMLPAESVSVIDFRGASRSASGSSYAVPRLAALAARILQRSPDLSVAELKAEIFSRAVDPVFERSQVVAVGWIADPLAD